MINPLPSSGTFIFVPFFIEPAPLNVTAHGFSDSVVDTVPPKTILFSCHMIRASIDTTSKHTLPDILVTFVYYRSVVNTFILFAAFDYHMVCIVRVRVARLKKTGSMSIAPTHPLTRPAPRPVTYHSSHCLLTFPCPRSFCCQRTHVCCRLFLATMCVLAVPLWRRSSRLEWAALGGVSMFLAAVDVSKFAISKLRVQVGQL